MSDDRLKSAYELAMERFKKKDAEAGVVSTPLTEAQKAAIAELRSQYQAKMAELEILHRSQLMAMVDPAARAAADDDYARQRQRLNAEREAKIERVRLGTDRP
jgi:hypothetical protein